MSISLPGFGVKAHAEVQQPEPETTEPESGDDE